MAGYRKYAEDVAPPWGAELWERLHSVIGLFFDQFAEGAERALAARYIAGAPADALDYVARERGLERGLTETTASFRQRLREAFEAYQYAGTEKAIKDQLAPLGYTAVTVYEAEDWYPGSSEWWRFWVVIDEPHEFPLPSVVWDSFTWDSFTWDGDDDAVEAICRVIEKWKPAHAKLEAAIVVHSGSLWDHSLTWDDFTWDGSATTFSC